MIEVRAKAAFDLTIYDWVVLNGIAYRVHKIERGDVPLRMLVTLSNGVVKQMMDAELVSVLAPKNS